ncbi:nuclear transport factor 2 family protein [Nocardioides immobilis]|uniref:nuclear transport factor 2 family protein n=1 Tax=Nocardioides immobilis TaxID=2049295 RepID=UPI0015F7DEE0|nr:nuclear transport factor 2 family protein [Nocardioides immobilis]
MDFQERAAIIVAVSDVLARLTHAADLGTLEEYAALLTEDFVWEMPDMPVVGLPAQVRRGREGAVIGARERRDAAIQGPGTGTFHVITNISVMPGRNESTATTYWHFYTGAGGDPALRAQGIYRDRFVLVDGEWLIARRQLVRP